MLQSVIASCYIATRTGPMTKVVGPGTAFPKTRRDLETPGIQFHVQPFSADKINEGPHKFSAFTASILQLRALSKGHLDLNSAEISDHPAIHPSHLATKSDCDPLVDGIRIARRILKAAPLASLITSGNTNAAVIMFAEKAPDMILEDAF